MCKLLSLDCQKDLAGKGTEFFNTFVKALEEFKEGLGKDKNTTPVFALFIREISLKFRTKRDIKCRTIDWSDGNGRTIKRLNWRRGKSIGHPIESIRCR